MHGRRLAEQIGQGSRVRLRGLVRCLVGGGMGQRALHQIDGGVHIKRLGQILKSAATERADSAVEVRKRRHDDDDNRGVVAFDLRQQIQPRAAAHADVADQHLRLRACGQRRQHIGAAAKAARGQVDAGQCFFEHKAD